MSAIPENRTAADPAAMKERLKRTFVAALCGANTYHSPLVSTVLDDDPDLGGWGEVVGEFKPITIPADHALVAIGVAHGLVENPSVLQLLKRKQGLLVFVDPGGELTETLKLDLAHLLQSVTKERPRNGRSAFDLLMGDLRSDRIAGKVQAGRIVVDVVPSLRSLDKGLKRMATVVHLPRLDGERLCELIEVVTGKRPAEGIPDPDVRRLDLFDLLHLFGTERSADEHVAAIRESVAKARAAEKDAPRLEDAHGYGKARDWGLEMATDLSDYALGVIDWKDVDRRGLLLDGPPGVGKTQFAKLVARSAEVPLIETSVSDWMSASYLSGTLKAIDASFEKARSVAPCMLFIDERDGISNRADLRGEYVQYWTQVLNHLLTALGDEEALEGVVVIAATNHPERIDPAVLRSGRISDAIAIGRPGVEDRAAILKDYLGEDADHVDVRTVAGVMHGNTGADISHLVRQARSKARRAKTPLDTETLMSIVLDADEAPDGVRWVTAVHEAGHAVVAKALGIDVTGVTAAGFGGWTSFDMGKGATTDDEVERQIQGALAGREAERLICGAVSSGSGGSDASDLATATRMAVVAAARYGLGPDGPVHLPSLPDVARGIAEKRLEEHVRDRLHRASAMTAHLVERYREAIEAVARKLLADRYVAGSDLPALMDAAGPVDLMDGPTKALKALPRPNGQAAAEDGAPA